VSTDLIHWTDTPDLDYSNAHKFELLVDADDPRAYLRLLLRLQRY
jgi:hypothetical protein